MLEQATDGQNAAKAPARNRESGKSSGARVIYFLRLREDEIVLVTMYAKNVRGNVDAKLLKQLRKAYEESQRGT